MAETHRRGKKRSVIALAAFVTLAGAGVAFAYWTSSGSGTGLATTGESVAFTITADEAEGEISPGSDGQTVDFTVENTSTGSLFLEDVTVTLADAEGIPWAPPPGCLLGDYDVVLTEAPDYGEIPAAGTVTGTVTVTLAASEENQDACQGAEVPLYFLAS